MKQTLTRILVALLAFSMIFVIAACGGNTDDPAGTDPSATTTEAGDPEATEPAATTTKQPEVTEPEPPAKEYTVEDYKALYVYDGLLLHVNFAAATPESPILPRDGYTFQNADGVDQFSTDGGATWKAPTDDASFRCGPATFAPYLFVGTDGDVTGGSVQDYYLDGKWPKNYGASSFGNGYFTVGANSRLAFNLVSTLAATTQFTFEFSVKNYDAENTAITGSSFTNYIGGRWSFGERGGLATYAANASYNVPVGADPSNPSVSISEDQVNTYTVVYSMVDANGAPLEASDTVSFGAHNAKGGLDNAEELMKILFAANGGEFAERLYQFKWDCLGSFFGDSKSVSAHVYNFRVYDRALTQEEAAQNHFADLALNLKLDITGYLALSDEQKATVHGNMSAYGLADDAARVARALKTYVDRAAGK